MKYICSQLCFLAKCVVFVWISVIAACSTPEKVEEREAWRLVVNQQLKSDQEDSLIIERLQAFLLTKNEAAWQNDYWLPSDFSQYTYPFVDLYNIEEEGVKYTVEILELLETDKAEEKIVKIAYLKKAANESASLTFIYNLLAVKYKGEYYFKRILSFNTSNWQQHELDGFTYFISPQKEFNKQEALAQVAFKNTMIDFFGVNIPTITYYSCVNPIEMFQVKGYDYISNMYMASTGGLSEAFSGILFSGANSERYDHELVHFFTNELFQFKMQPLFHEGIATYFGGSGGERYELLKGELANYLLAHPELSLVDLMAPYQRVHLLAENIDATYVVGALVCDYVREKMGKAALLDLISTPAVEDVWLALEKVGLGKASFSEKMRTYVFADLSIQ